MISRALVLITLILPLLACSNQWRDADANITASQLMEMLDQVQQSAGAGNSDLSTALALKNDPNAAIYFADAPGPVGMGSVASIASLVDWSFIGQDGTDLWHGNIAEVRVFFIDAPNASGRATALILGVKKKGATAFTHYGFNGTGVLGDDDYTTVLSQGGQVKLILKSVDAEEGDLEPVIQLKAFLPGDIYIGKFSTLVGFGP